jgi:hypothetical protein
MITETISKQRRGHSFDDAASFADTYRFDLLGFTCSAPAYDGRNLPLSDQGAHVGGLELGEVLKPNLFLKSLYGFNFPACGADIDENLQVNDAPWGWGGVFPYFFLFVSPFSRFGVNQK